MPGVKTALGGFYDYTRVSHPPLCKSGIPERDEQVLTPAASLCVAVGLLCFTRDIVGIVCVHIGWCVRDHRCGCVHVPVMSTGSISRFLRGYACDEIFCFFLFVCGVRWWLLFYIRYLKREFFNFFYCKGAREYVKKLGEQGEHFFFLFCANGKLTVIEFVWKYYEGN